MVSAVTYGSIGSFSSGERKGSERTREVLGIGNGSSRHYDSARSNGLIGRMCECRYAVGMGIYELGCGSTIVRFALEGSSVVGISGITTVMTESWRSIVGPGCGIGLGGTSGNGTIENTEISGTAIEDTLGSGTVPSIS